MNRRLIVSSLIFTFGFWLIVGIHHYRRHRAEVAQEQRIRESVSLDYKPLSAKNAFEVKGDNLQLVQVAPLPPLPAAGHIECWQAERSDHTTHVMCGDSWGSMVDVSEALEKKHQEFCKTIPNSNGAQICNGATWRP